MKRIILASLCVMCVFPVFAQEKKSVKVPSVIVNGGDFKELAKNKINGNEVMFVKNWSYYSNKPFKLEKNSSGAYEVTTNGCLGGGFGVPKGCPQGYDYKLTVTAKGKTLSLRTWSWVGYNPRSNHRRLSIPGYKLTDTFKDYTFTFPCIPNEYYVVLWVDGDKTISRIKCELVPAAAGNKTEEAKNVPPAKK